jgi:prepilin-type N-terminal cleavage/methylation domain-containing protein
MSQFNKSGFTLIELIVVLVLLGIIGLFSGLFLVKMIQSYQWTADNAHTAQKAQVALTRIAVEMAFAYAERGNITINGDTITISNNHGSWIVQKDNDNNLKLSDDILTDLVTDFEVQDGYSYITVELTITGTNQVDQKFTQKIAKPK